MGDQTGATSLKNAKVETLREVLRSVMTRVAPKFGVKSSKYQKFGTDSLVRQMQILFITGKRVVRAGNMFLNELTEKELTSVMLADITSLCNDFENLIIDMKIKMVDRDVLQEEPVETANNMYNILVSYTNTGQSIWSTTNVTKHNDYVLFNTPTAEATEVLPII